MNVTKDQWQKIAGIVLTAALAIAAVLGWFIPVQQPPAPDGPQFEIQASGQQDFSWIAAKKLTVLAGGANFQSAATFDSDVTVDDTFSIDDTDSTVTGTATLTPTASFYELNPASQLTLTLATGSAEVGDILILVNISSQTVNVVDTGATQGGAAVPLGQDDPAIFIYTNSKWVELASPDNS